MGLRAPAKEDAHAVDIDPGILREIGQKTMAEKNQIPSDISLQKAKFIVFDLETTGFYPYEGDEIISVSAVTVENENIKKGPSLDHLVNPHRIIPPTITELTGISNEMAERSPSVLWVLNEFLSFARGGILVAHHAGFDLGFINLKLKQFCNASLSHPVIDTFILAKAALPKEKYHTLDSLIRFYKLSSAGRHTSLGDAVITAEILVKILGDLSLRGVETLQDLNNYCYWSSYMRK
jgi:DNA polymerase-3 subunit epsilon